MNAVSWANDNGATEVSMSWDGPEFSGETTEYDSYFDAKSTSTGAPILYTASAGDSGSGAVYPAASPNVIAVGGTTLNGCNDTSCAHFSSETAWSGSGGGVSAYEKIPAYQSGYGGPVYSESSGGISALTGGMRAIPDVSFEANPDTGVSIYDSTTYSNGQSGWFTVGGTSVGAPNWAGIFAAGASTATALQGAQAIYGGGYASYLKDITSGSNGSCGTDSGRYRLRPRDRARQSGQLSPTSDCHGREPVVGAADWGNGRHCDGNWLRGREHYRRLR